MHSPLYLRKKDYFFSGFGRFSVLVRKVVISSGQGTVLCLGEKSCNFLMKKHK